jgi:hypothetical protein
MTVEIRVIKSEWHQVEKRYGMLITRYELDEIYPESSEEENDQLWQQLIDNDFDFDELRHDAEIQEVWLDWEWLDEDDWWTDRKGGYEVTYEVEADYQAPKQDWEIIRDLKAENAKLKSQLLGNTDETDDEDIVEISELESALEDLKREFEELLEDELVPCFSCGDLYDENKLPELSGQYHCPSCHEGWVMMESREEEDDEEWVEVGSEDWTEEMDKAAKEEDDKPTKK